MSELRALIDASSILLDVPAQDWREAIHASGEILVASSATEPAYTDAMVSTVLEHGPYIVIAPGFALAHARPDDSVRRTALSFVRLAEPVAFGHEDNDPVRIVMALAARDAQSHRSALAGLAESLADPARRAILDDGGSAEEILGALAHDAGPAAQQDDAPAARTASVASRNLLLTVCGNGLGTSLFLKNTAEKVLDRWGWTPYLSVEATDTISAKGKAKDADLILTSGAIADALGDVGTPVQVITDFTSQREIDAALRSWYDV